MKTRVTAETEEVENRAGNTAGVLTDALKLASRFRLAYQNYLIEEKAGKTMKFLD
jgi:hypothetical protein